MAETAPAKSDVNDDEDDIMAIDIELELSTSSACDKQADDCQGATKTEGAAECEPHDSGNDSDEERESDISAVFSGALAVSPGGARPERLSQVSGVGVPSLDVPGPRAVSLSPTPRTSGQSTPTGCTGNSNGSERHDRSRRSSRYGSGEESDNFTSDPDHVWQSIRRKAAGGELSSGSSSSAMKGDEKSRRAEAAAVEVKRLSVLAVKSAARHCRRSFAHYDGVSALTNLSDSYGLSDRSFDVNVPCGASAVNNSAAEEVGELRGNEFVLAAPQFWNELGGDLHNRSSLKKPGQIPLVFYPASSTGIVLEVSLSHTIGDERERKRRRFCQLPLWRPLGGHQVDEDMLRLHFNNFDLGALYYRFYFAEQDHLNLFGIDDGLGPIAISLRRETIELNSVNRYSATDLQLSAADLMGPMQMRAPGGVRHQYRVIVRTARPFAMRGTVSEDSIVAAGAQLRPTANNPGLSIRDVITFVAPEAQLSCLRIGQNTQKTVDTLLKLDEQGLSSQYKVGVVYCKANQCTEEQMYNNEEGSPLFYEFLDCIAEKVELKGFTGYRGQLDNKNDSTGLHSYYTQFEGMEVMFHVSTMLPHTPNHQQQLLRKRHIGNDIVTIVFQEEDSLPFTPAIIRSQFQHVFIIVRAKGKCPATGKPRFALAVSQAKDTPPFGPPLPENPVFVLGSRFRRFMLTKVINAECAAHSCQKFFNMSMRTRFEYLSTLAKDYTTSVGLEGGSGGLLSRLRKQLSNEKSKSANLPMATTVDLLHLPGAMVWPVIVQDWGLGEENHHQECLLAMSHAGVVFLDPEQQIVRCNIPPEFVAGWTTHKKSIRVFYRSNAYVKFALNCGPVLSDEAVAEVLVRLSACSKGCAATELVLRKDDMTDHGFLVHTDGVISEVNEDMPGYAAGIRGGSRIVEMDGVPVYGQPMSEVVTHLREAVTIKAIVIPPNPDGSPRGGRHRSSTDLLASGEVISSDRSPPPIFVKTSVSDPPSPESRSRVTLRKRMNEKWMHEVLGSAASPKPRGRIGSVDSPSLRGVVRKAKDRLAARTSGSQLPPSPMHAKRSTSASVVD